MERIDLARGSDEFGSTTLPLNKDYAAQMSEVRITPTLPRMESHIPPSCFFVRRHRKGTTSGAIRPGRAACRSDAMFGSYVRHLARTDEPEY